MGAHDGLGNIGGEGEVVITDEEAQTGIAQEERLARGEEQHFDKPEEEAQGQQEDGQILPGLLQISASE